MKFSQVKNLNIPEGKAARIIYNGRQLWEHFKYNYVSFGDSIAAGHSINNEWESQYGTDSQYGVHGNTHTVIVPNTYTYLIQQELINDYGPNDTDTISFARSGDQVHHLISKLDDEIIKEWVRKADLVTICIGANNILTPALEVYLERYVTVGASALEEFDVTINNNLAILSAGRNSATNLYPEGSYGLLFDKLYNLNPKATYVLTTIYNPYKYLWLEEGANGFFQPLIDTVIPEWSITVPNINYEIRISDWIKEGLLQTSFFRKLFSRANGLGDWVDLRIEKLNVVIRNAVSEYNAYRQNQSNFKVTEAKQTFDTYPDRPISAPVHYNDLVNVEFTRGYNISDIDWAILWRTAGKTREDYFYDLAAKHTYWMTTSPYVDFDIEGFASEVGGQILNLLIVPNVDPHPKVDGHIVLKEIFSNTVGL